MRAVKDFSRLQCAAFLLLGLVTSLLLHVDFENFFHFLHCQWLFFVKSYFAHVRYDVLSFAVCDKKDFPRTENIFVGMNFLLCAASRRKCDGVIIFVMSSYMQDAQK